ncbi:hypothetical protein DFJ73DRAFT_869881 [Zopfochytrium polystomum]|nr:hypothetical protein DFJ73DRAFT_869881 [Zopfochytrium polystomum]
MGSGSTLAGSQVIASPLDEGGVGSSDAAKKGALRRMSEPMPEIPKRRGWSSNGLPEDLEDEPMLRWVGLNMKWRYPVPYDAEHSYSCAGLVTACQRPVALSAVVIKWKKRWMIVKDNKAYLLKKPNSREASALIKLDDCVVDPSPFNALPHSFRLMPPPVSAPERSANEMMWVIVAATENAKLDWMAAIMTAAGWKEKSMGAFSFVTKAN